MLHPPSPIRLVSRWALIMLVLCTLLVGGLKPTLAQGSTGDYQDPGGRFTVPVPSSWRAETKSGGYVSLSDPDGTIKVYVVVLASDDLRQAILDGWTNVRPDFKFSPQQTDELPSDSGVEKTLLLTQVSIDKKTIYYGVGQLVKGQVYLLLYEADLVVAEKRATEIQIITSGFTIVALKKTDLTSVTPKTVDSAITRELETYITATMAKFGIPGSAIAIVQGGKVAYAKGFGVRELGNPSPITPDTYMMIGSTTKPMTALMMGTLVDDGKLS